MSEIIISKQNSFVKAAFALRQGDPSLFLIEGYHLVEMALSAGAVKEIFAVKEYPHLPSSVVFHLVGSSIIEKLAFAKNPEGIVAVCERLADREIASERVLFLDAVSDPGNIGTLIRSALSFGFSDVVLGAGCADEYNPRTLLASQGAIFGVNAVLGKGEPSDAVRRLKAAGYSIIGTDLKSAVPLGRLSHPAGKIVLVLGNEARGVSPEILALCDERIKIEMAGIDSLNVAVAGGIAMYILRR